MPCSIASGEPGDPRSRSPRSPRSFQPADDKPIDGIVVAPDAYSFGELIRHKEFERMTQAELRDAERLVDLLRPKLELRRTRRQA